MSKKHADWFDENDEELKELIAARYQVGAVIFNHNTRSTNSVNCEADAEYRESLLCRQ